MLDFEDLEINIEKFRGRHFIYPSNKLEGYEFILEKKATKCNRIINSKKVKGWLFDEIGEIELFEMLESLFDAKNETRTHLNLNFVCGNENENENNYFVFGPETEMIEAEIAFLGGIEDYLIGDDKITTKGWWFNSDLVSKETLHQYLLAIITNDINDITAPIIRQITYDEYEIYFKNYSDDFEIGISTVNAIKFQIDKTLKFRKIQKYAWRMKSHVDTKLLKFFVCGLISEHCDDPNFSNNGCYFEGNIRNYYLYIDIFSKDKFYKKFYKKRATEYFDQNIINKLKILFYESNKGLPFSFYSGVCIYIKPNRNIEYRNKNPQINFVFTYPLTNNDLNNGDLSLNYQNLKNIEHKRFMSVDTIKISEDFFSYVENCLKFSISSDLSPNDFKKPIKSSKVF